MDSMALRLFRLGAIVGEEDSTHAPGTCRTAGVGGSSDRLLKDIARNMQLGRAIVLIPENQQFTTQRAADLLGVSRPHLIKLLEAGELPYHKAGSHRRVYLKDLATYQKRRDAERKAALDSIAREAFESGLYDRTGIPEAGEDE